MDLYHYYERAHGPFRNPSDLPLAEAEVVLARIRERGEGFASQRAADYLQVRHELEDRVRALFIAKGGNPTRLRPHYMIVGRCDWVKSWYVDGAAVRIPLSAFALEHVSFTYGDTFPALRYGDGKATRGQVYTLAELPALIARFGLPQECNPDGRLGPDRYIEAQVWDNAALRRYGV